MAEGVLNLIRQSLAQLLAKTQAISEAKIWLVHNASSAVTPLIRDSRRCKGVLSGDSLRVLRR